MDINKQVKLKDLACLLVLPVCLVNENYTLNRFLSLFRFRDSEGDTNVFWAAIITRLDDNGTASFRWAVVVACGKGIVTRLTK